MRVQHIDGRLSRITSFLAAERFCAAAGRVSAALKYNPNWHLQPRVPAGDPEGGQWMPFGRAMAGSLLPVLRKIGPPALRVLRETARRVAPVLRRLPRRWDDIAVPRRERFRGRNAADQFLVMAKTRLPQHTLPQRGRTATKSRPAGPGREWHHIVEKRLADHGMFPVEIIHSTDNIINLPKDVHRWVSDHMSSKAGEFQDLVRRFGVERLDFGDQYNFGLDLISRGLERFGYDPSRF